MTFLEWLENLRTVAGQTTARAAAGDMSCMAAEQGIRELSRDEGRAMLGGRTQRDLGVSLEAFEKACGEEQLDASDPKVAGLVRLPPLTRRPAS